MTSPRISQALRHALLAANDALVRRRAADIPEATLDRLVALRLLQWKAGSLGLTEAGEALLVEVHAALLCDAEAA